MNEKIYFFLNKCLPQHIKLNIYLHRSEREQLLLFCCLRLIHSVAALFLLLTIRSSYAKLQPEVRSHKIIWSNTNQMEKTKWQTESNGVRTACSPSRSPQVFSFTIKSFCFRFSLLLLLFFLLHFELQFTPSNLTMLAFIFLLSFVLQRKIAALQIENYSHTFMFNGISTRATKALIFKMNRIVMIITEKLHSLWYACKFSILPFRAPMQMAISKQT